MKFGLFYNTGFYGTDPDQMITRPRPAARACAATATSAAAGSPRPNGPPSST
jgi:hypothetical protein